jgi:acyl-CoA synthetase (NDP forming)
VKLIRRLAGEIIEAIKAPIRNLMEKEPTRVVGVVGAAVAAGAAWAATALGIHIPESLMPWVVLVLGGAIVEFIRRAVYAPATVQKIANAATLQPAGTTVDIGQPPNTDASPPLPAGG